MIARLRAAWLTIVNIAAMLWAIAHCWLTAFGSPTERYIAAGAGVLGAAAILIVLNLSIRAQVRQEIVQETIGERLTRLYHERARRLATPHHTPASAPALSDQTGDSRKA